MYVKQLQTWAVGIQVTKMDGIAMTEACGIEQLAIVIQSSGTPNNLVLAIAVNVSNRQVVVAIGKQGVATAATCGLGCCHLGRLLHVGINY